jgi:hypothetical protein
LNLVLAILFTVVLVSIVAALVLCGMPVPLLSGTAVPVEVGPWPPTLTRHSRAAPDGGECGLRSGSHCGTRDRRRFRNGWLHNALSV